MIRPEIVFIALLNMLTTAWPYLWMCLRPVLGWSSIALGVFGVILPIIPGIPFLVVGTILVGRRTRIIRWVKVHWKLLLRRLAASQHPLIGPVGRWSWMAQKETSRQCRRVSWWYKERSLQRQQPQQ